MIKNILIISSDYTGHGHKSITEALCEEFAQYEDINVKVIDGFSLGGKALLQAGGLTSSYFGYLGDVFQHRTYKGRAYLTALVVFLAAPIYTAMFVIPMNNLLLPDKSNPIVVLAYLLKEIILNPWIISMFILSFLAAAAQSANIPSSKSHANYEELFI